MIYVDTDVLVNFFVKHKEAEHLHPIAIQAMQQVIDRGLFFISVHSLNELGFALAKCGQSREAIPRYVSRLYLLAANGLKIETSAVQRWNSRD